MPLPEMSRPEMTQKIKYIFISFCILTCSLRLKAQDRTLDSLKVAFKNAKHDTTRCNILNELIEAEIDEKIWPIYNVQLLKLAEKGAATSSTSQDRIPFYLKHLAAALNNIGYLAEQQGYIPKAVLYYHRSLKIQEKIKDKIGIANSLNNIGVIYRNQGDIPKAILYYQKSLKIQEEIKDKLGIAVSFDNFGSIYHNQGDIPKALVYFHKCLKIYEEIKDKGRIANSLNNIGVIYNNQGDIFKALEYYHRTLKIQEEINHKNGIAYSLINIGVIYNQQGDISKALEYFHRSLKLQEEILDKRGISSSLNNIGAIYTKQGDITKALEYYCRSLKIREEINDKKGIATSLNNLGSIYEIKNNFSEALGYELKSLKLFEEIKDRQWIAFTTQKIADLLIKKGNIIDALNYAKYSFQTAKELGYPENIKRAASSLKKIYKKQTNFRASLEMYELEILMRDSINNAETKKASIRKQFQYQYEKKAAADSVKNAEEQKVKNAQLSAQQAQLKQEKTQRFALYGGLFLVVAFSGFVFNRFKVTQRQKTIIENQKGLVDSAYEKLHEKNKEVMDSIIYARRIQSALLTPEKYITKELDRLANR